jgi:Undecaprenyl-phosphate glucose phosphotransferase
MTRRIRGGKSSAVQPANDTQTVVEAVDLPRPPTPAPPALTRRRTSRRMLVRTLHMFDIGVIVLLAHAILSARHGDWLEQSVSSILPYVVVCLSLFWGMWATGCYNPNTAFFRLRHMTRAFGGLVLAGAVAMAVLIPFIGWSAFQYSAGLLLALSPYPIIAVHLLMAFYLRRALREGSLAQAVVLIGATEDAAAVIAALGPQPDMHIVGIFDDRADRAPHRVKHVPVVGTIDDLMNWPSLPHVERIIVSIPASAEDRIRTLIARLSVLPQPITLLSNLHRLGAADLAADRVGSLPATTISAIPHDEFWVLAKRAQDLILGSLALVLLSPFMIVAAIAIRLDSPGPVLFVQKRLGFRNEVIHVYKFRSMHTHQTDASSTRQVQAGDERVTRVGRIIRKTSIDELPQLFNVLKGDMSLVGPRPHAVGMCADDALVHTLLASYGHRHRVKPGITGWAQINGSRGACETRAAIERRVQLDLEYIARANLWLDLWIMALTIPCFLGDSETVR